MDNSSPLRSAPIFYRKLAKNCRNRAKNAILETTNNEVPLIAKTTQQHQPEEKFTSEPGEETADDEEQIEQLK